jgi:hypothetical protein
MRNNFKIVGTLEKPKGFGTTTINSDGNSKWEGLALLGRIKSGEDSIRLKFFGGENKKGSTVEGKKITVKDENGNTTDEFVVEYSERFDEEVLEKVPNFYKQIVMLNGLRHEFIFSTDFIKFVEENYDELMKSKVRVTGDVGLTYSEEHKRTFKDFTVRNIFTAKDDEEDSAIATMEIYYVKGAVDENIFDGKSVDVKTLQELNNRVKINVFTLTSNPDKSTKEMYKTVHMPLTVMFDGSKLDYSQEICKKVAAFMLNNFKIKDAGKVYKSAWDMRIVAGKEELEYTEDDVAQLLTEEEKEYIELFGEQKAKALMAKKMGKSVYGTFTDELRLKTPNENCPFKTLADEVSVDMLELYKVLIKKKEKEDKPTKKKEKVETVEQPTENKEGQSAGDIEQMAAKWF